mgnify:CR=1 FL=1
MKRTLGLQFWGLALMAAGLVVGPASGQHRVSGGGGASGESVLLIGDSEGAVKAPAPWMQEDPGARAYAQAREYLNSRRYQEASEAFSQLRAQYARSVYAADSYYYQAFALSRMGGRDELREARDLLRAQIEYHTDSSTFADARELMVRVESQLARQGDASAAAAITQQATDPCGPDQELRAAALNALLNMYAERAVPILRQVLEDRDACSAELRQQAIFLLSQKLDDESVDLAFDQALPAHRTGGLSDENSSGGEAQNDRGYPGPRQPKPRKQSAAHCDRPSAE